MQIEPKPDLNAGLVTSPDNNEFVTADTPIGRVSDKGFRERGMDDPC